MGGQSQLRGAAHAAVAATTPITPLGQSLLAQAPDEESKKIITEGMEISDELFEKHAAEIFREAGNRQHTIKAVLAATMGI